MDKISAQKLIESTFNFPFNENNFTKFSLNLLDQIKINSSTSWKNNSSLSNQLKEFIKEYKVFGQMEYQNGDKILVAMIKLNSPDFVEKSRYVQRDIAKWLLHKYDSEACLISFFSENYEDWRFSLIKIEYEKEETRLGKISIKQKLTSLKRYSYLVGKNEPNHTAQTQLSPLLFEENKNPSIEKIIEAFSIEKVNQEFFENYRDLTFEIEKEIINLRKKDKFLNLNFKRNNIDDLEFAKKIMGQIVFIYFLQKKKFVGHKFVGDKFEKKGPQDFLMKLFNSNTTNDYKSYNNFFNDILEPLFYSGFAKKRKNNYFKKLNCFVPFLSSELFEPINEYDWKKTEILLSNNIFQKIFETFNRFNFTVREEEPLETEVAVDPEMLGKVLENLLPDKEKRFTGTFYTPRPVVNYMCNKAIENFLKLHFNQEINDDDFQKIILISSSEYNYSVSKNYFSKNFDKIFNKIDEKLKNIFICDPAIGSGAFTVALMNKIVQIRLFLNHLDNNKNNKYLFKRNFIEKCMYGVDIEPSAVDTAKLRLYLSLIVDEDKIENLQQLPNLDFKIMQGNSLINEYKNIKLNLNFSLDNLEIISDQQKIEKMINKLKQLKNELIYTEDFEIKNLKKKEINKLIYDIFKIKLKSINIFNASVKEGVKELLDEKTKKNFFPWEIYFSEVFSNKGGFDIVIANPPYKSYGLRGVTSLQKHEKELLKKIYPHSAEYKISFYAIFMDLCTRLTNAFGTKILIVPDSFLLGIYFSKIRSLLLTETNLKFISFFTYKVFEADVGYTVIYMADKKKDFYNKITTNLITNEFDLINNSYKTFSYSKSLFDRIDHRRFRLFFDTETLNLVEKIEKNNIPFLKYLSGHTGIRSKIGKDDIISKKKKDRFYKKGLVSSSQIEKFKVIYDEDWISTNSEILWSGGHDKSIIEKEKILIRQTGDKIIAAIDKEKYYHLNNIHSFSHMNKTINLECILGYLNSKIFQFYYQNVTLEKKRVMAQIDIENIEKLKIKEFNNQFQEVVKDLVNRIQVLKNKNSSEAEINELMNLLDTEFYKIYNLSKKEIDFIQNFIDS